MKVFGIVLIVFSVLMFISATNLVVTGKHDISTTDGIQMAVGGYVGAVLPLALGLWLANRKKPSKPTKIREFLD